MPILSNHIKMGTLTGPFTKKKKKTTQPIKELYIPKTKDLIKHEPTEITNRVDLPVKSLLIRRVPGVPQSVLHGTITKRNQLISTKTNGIPHSFEKESSGHETNKRKQQGVGGTWMIARVPNKMRTHRSARGSTLVIAVGAIPLHPTPAIL